MVQAGASTDIRRIAERNSCQHQCRSQAFKDKEYTNPDERLKHYTSGPKVRPLPQRLWPIRRGERIRLKYPLPYLAQEVSPYGWRFSDHRKKWRLHTGHDLIAPAGTGVLAALSGKALMVQPISGHGLTVLLDHGNGWQTLYAHLLRARIRPGQLTQTGDLIGNVGKSGHASTAHLHFELRRFKNGQMMAIDPAPLLNQSSRR